MQPVRAASIALVAGALLLAHAPTAPRARSRLSVTRGILNARRARVAHSVGRVARHAPIVIDVGGKKKKGLGEVMKDEDAESIASLIEEDEEDTSKMSPEELEQRLERM